MKIGYLYIAICTILVSTMEIVLKTISGVYNPIQLTMIRFFIGGLVLLPFALRHMKKAAIHFRFRDLLPFVWIGFIGVTLSMSLYQFAVCYTEASVVAVLFSSNPLFVLIFAYFLIKEPINKNHIIALALDIIGIICVIAPWNMQLNMVGVVTVLLATVLSSIYAVMGKKYSEQYGGVVNSCFSIMGGCALLIVFMALTHIPAIGDAFSRMGLEVFSYIPFLHGLSWSTMPQVLYASVCVTGIGYALSFMASEKTSAKTVSLIFFFKPILAPLLALLILNEAISGNRLLGILLILAGSLTNLLPPLLKERREKLKDAVQ